MGHQWFLAGRSRFDLRFPLLIGTVCGLSLSSVPNAVAAPDTPPRPAATRDNMTASAGDAATTPNTRLESIDVVGQLLESATAPVDGYVAKRNRSATKTDTPLIRVPQAVTTITADQIEAQNATSLSQVLRYSSGGVPELRGAGQNRYDLFNLRGFSPDLYLNGLRLGGYFYTIPRVDPFLLERVDILKGPASVLYGQTPPGGVVNLVSKRPSKDAVNQVFVQGGDDGRVRGGFDLNGQADADGNVRYRVVGVGGRQDGLRATPDTSTFSIAPSVTFDISDATELTVMAEYRNDPEVGSPGGLPYAGTVNPRDDGSRIPRGFFVGDRGFDSFYRRQKQIGTEFSHRFNEHVEFRQNLRYLQSEVQYHSVYARGYADPATQRALTRGSVVSDESLDSIAVDNQLLLTFDTGPLGHTVLAGMDYQNLNANRQYGYGSAATATTPSSLPPTLSLDDPDYHQRIVYPSTQHYGFDQDQLGYYLQDQIALGNLVLIGGGRYDRIQTAQTIYDTNDHQDRVDYSATVRAGALYAFDFGLSPYFSYTESFQPPSTDGVSPNVREPTQGNQYEIGVKYQPNGIDALITASLFKIRQKNVTGDTLPDGTVTQTGEVEVKGAEIEAKASLAAGLDLSLAGTYLDSEITRSDEGNRGNELNQTPTYTGSVWLDYTQPTGRLQGLGGGFGVRYVGTQPIGNANTAEVPDYTVFDGTVHYTLGALSQRLKGWRVAVNMQNMFDKRYVASCLSAETFCYYGAERRTTASVSYRWQ
ncbi:TonB-dependent siderophore receptor [Salinisphaera sp. Q1T1-3]|uniref:TonB-dependent siderophore receptor n=1 Tax=Salinisphaera sp. Q1T1-3 TaxID=2321229 RepID=UPI001313F1E9|nr:TonB-dependent siderophore receptor [Salinisphaera sp. Q1T1-3]